MKRRDMNRMLRSTREPPAILVAHRDLSRCAWVTLVTSADYLEAALVLARSLKASETRVSNFVLLTTSRELSDNPRLQEHWNTMLVDAVQFDNPRWSLKEGQSRFQLVLSKLRIFQLEQYERVVYLDADCLVLENIDDLFRRDERIAALHPGRRRPYVVNMGVVSLKPDKRLFDELMAFFRDKPEQLYIYDEEASALGQLKNPDQALINGYFRYHGLPIGYLEHRDNLSAHRASRGRIRVVHFTTKAKPWNADYHLETNALRKKRFEMWRKFATRSGA